MIPQFLNHRQAITWPVGLVCMALAALSSNRLVHADDRAARRPRSTQQIALEIKEIEPATSSNDARKTVAAGIPLDQLEDHHRVQVEALLEARTLFRCLPALRIELEPASYEYYRRNPGIAVAVWQVLGISKLQLKSTAAPGLYTIKSEDGSDGTIEVMLQTDDLLIVRGTGTWHRCCRLSVR